MLATHLRDQCLEVYGRHLGSIWDIWVHLEASGRYLGGIWGGIWNHLGARGKTYQNICILKSKVTRPTVSCERGEGGYHQVRSLRTKVDRRRAPVIRESARNLQCKHCLGETNIYIYIYIYIYVVVLVVCLLRTHLFEYKNSNRRARVRILGAAYTKIRGQPS